MPRYIFLGSILLISWLTSTQGKGWAGQDSCSRISNVEIKYKDYYLNYLGFNLTTQSVDTAGAFYSYIKVAVNECCHFMDVSFTKLNRTLLEVEDLALTAVGENVAVVPRPFVFYFPEFTTNNDRVVYDFDLQFIKLARSSGQAVVMLKPESKKQVSMFYIFKESSPMLVMMLAMSWFVGILGWITDHWKNPEEFPSPFIFGMFEGFWWAIVTMTTVGYGDKAPKSVPARVLAVVWVLMSAVFLSLFTANATSILNQSLKEEDYTETVGKKIGVFQSKSFDEFQLNMGAEIINFERYEELDMALREGNIDRFLYPDYKGLILLFNNFYQEAKKEYEIVKVFDSPFQIGMVLSMLPELLSDEDRSFLRCLRNGISSRDRWTKRFLNYGSIVHSEENTDEDVTAALNQDHLLTATYYFLAAIAGLAFFGIAWDVWKYHLKRKTNDSEFQAEVVDVEPGKHNDGMNRPVMNVNNEENQAIPQIKDDETWF